MAAAVAYRLPYCVDQPVAARVARDCGLDEDRRLCDAVSAIQRASCSELGNIDFLAAVIERAGLTVSGVPWQSSTRLYGVEARHVVSSKEQKQAGFYQDPRQLAHAMQYFGMKVDVSTYVEFGVWTAWTFTLMGSYLQRVSSDKHGFASRAIDNDHRRISQATKQLWPSINASFAKPAQRHGIFHTLPEPVRGRGLIDVCFIDACHDYWCARSDYESFAPHCRYIMFHDVIDFEVLIGDPPWGGVVGLWAQIVSNSQRSRVEEFFSQPGTYPTRFGISVLGPHKTKGNAETDIWPPQTWRKWHRTGHPWVWHDAFCGPANKAQHDKCLRRRQAMYDGTFGGNPAYVNSTLDYGIGSIDTPPGVESPPDPGVR